MSLLDRSKYLNYPNGYEQQLAVNQANLANSQRNIQALGGLASQQSLGTPTREEQLVFRNAFNLAKWKQRYTLHVTNLDFQKHNQFAVARVSQLSYKLSHAPQTIQGS